MIPEVGSFSVPNELALINRLTFIINSTSLVSADADTFKQTVQEISKIIASLPFRQGSVKASYPDIPWEHFSVLSEIIQGGNDLARDLSLLIENMTTRTAIAQELSDFAKKLTEISVNFKKPAKEEVQEIDTTPNVQDFDKDDSLEQSALGFVKLQALTSFYRDHVTIEKIIKLLDSAGRIAFNTPNTDKVLFGLILALGEEVKKLSLGRRVALSQFAAGHLGKYEVNLLNRLWLYKKSRDSIRHAADFPENQLADLNEMVKKNKFTEDLLHIMSEDANYLHGYAHEYLEKEHKNLIQQLKSGRGSDYVSDFTHAAKSPEKKKKKNKSEKVAVEEKSSKNLPMQIKPIFAENDLKELLTIMAMMIDKRFGQGASVKRIDQLKRFLLRGDLQEYGVEASFTQSQRGPMLSDLTNTLCFQDVWQIVKDKNTSVTHDHTKLYEFLQEAFVGKRAEKQAVVKSPSLSQLPLPPDTAKDFWGKATLSNFIGELAEFARIEVLPNLGLKEADKLKLNNPVYIQQSIVDLHYFIFSEFLSKGFPFIDQNMIKLLRQFTSTDDPRFDAIFSVLSSTQPYTENQVNLQYVKQQFAFFFFGSTKPYDFFEKADKKNAIKANRGEIKLNWKKIEDQFNNIFDHPDKMIAKNDTKRPLEFVQSVFSLRPWENDYESLDNALLNIRMLLSTKYRQRKASLGFISHNGLNSAALLKKYVLHIREVTGLLKVTDKILKDYGEDLSHCENWGQVITMLGDEDSYHFMLNMAQISQHVANLTFITNAYLIPYMQNPPEASKWAKEKVDPQLLAFFKDCLGVLRSCGNALAHADLGKKQELDAIFSLINLTKLLGSLGSTLESMEEMVKLIPGQQDKLSQTLKSKMLETYHTVKIANKHFDPKSGKKFDPNEISELILRFAYPHSMKSLGKMIQSFGIFEPENEHKKESDVKPAAKSDVVRKQDKEEDVPSSQNETPVNKANK